MQSIIAAFNDIHTAQQAVEQLVAEGFSRSAVHLQSGQGADAAASATRTASPADPFGFATFFSALFSSDGPTEAGKYAEAVRRGSAVVAVDARSEGEVEKATRVMQELGSIDIDRQADEWKNRGWNGFDAGAKPLSSEEQRVERETVMPVVQEELQVGKRAVQGGGVRVVKRVTETPVSQLVTLREERASVERRPVDRPATEADAAAAFQEGTIEVRDVTEQATVGKTSHVVEEVVVGKQVSERTEEVSGTVRRSDVDVERVGATEVEQQAPTGKAQREATEASR